MMSHDSSHPVNVPTAGAIHIPSFNIPRPGSAQFRSFARDVLLPLGRFEKCSAHQIRLAQALAKLSPEITESRVHSLLYEEGSVLRETEAAAIRALYSRSTSNGPQPPQGGTTPPGQTPEDIQHQQAMTDMQRKIDALDTELAQARKDIAYDRKIRRQMAALLAADVPA